MSGTKENITSTDDTLIWPPPYTVRRHPLARHIKLRATRADGLIISMPMRTSLKHIPKILEANREWIITHLTEIKISTIIELPTAIELLALNQTWKIIYQTSEDKMRLFVRSQLHEVIVTGTVDQNKLFSLLKKWLKKHAVDYLKKELAHVSQQTNLPFTAISIRDQKTMWGSCSSTAAISLNYKLIFLPQALARHVMLHELCHTQHHNHSSRFWQLVAKHDLNWRQHKRELRLADRFMPAWV